MAGWTKLCPASHAAILQALLIICEIARAGATVVSLKPGRQQVRRLMVRKRDCCVVYIVGLYDGAAREDVRGVGQPT